MRRWQCRKIVEAEPITGWSTVGNVAIGDTEIIDVHADFFARGEPAIGDYFVRYPDGYVSWSPKKAFEEGYTKVEPTALELGATVRKVGLHGK